MLLHDSVLVPLSVDAAYETDSLDDPHDSIQSSSLLFPSDNDRNLGESGQHGEKGEAASSSCPECLPTSAGGFGSPAQHIFTCHQKLTGSHGGSHGTNFSEHTALIPGTPGRAARRSTSGQYLVAVTETSYRGKLFTRSRILVSSALCTAEQRCQVRN